METQQNATEYVYRKRKHLKHRKGAYLQKDTQQMMLFWFLYHAFCYMFIRDQQMH
jgi:hypothetical protein